MSISEHERAMGLMAEILSTHAWDRIPEALTEDAVFEYPQSGERFRGLANIRAQWENYPNLDPGTSQLAEVIGDEAYALTPAYTVIRIQGIGHRGTAIIRVRYPDGSWWWAVNVYELRDGRVAKSRVYFAPDFQAPDWRSPYREAP